MTVITGKTRIIGIIGYPVTHSLSPVMQNEALKACKLDMVYVPFSIPPDQLGQAVSGLKALGIHGFNVTIPHKQLIIPYLDELDESAETAGAVNTVLSVAGRLIGYNTDGDGLVDSLSADLNYIPGDDLILIVGAGGAARGAISALCRHHARRIAIMNRTEISAVQLISDMGNHYHQTEFGVVDLFNKNEILRTTSLVINTTSIGMNNDRIADLDIRLLNREAKIYDMVYSPAITPLLLEASESGHHVANGLGMLAGQGERAFKIWTGVVPPPGLMKRALTGICTI